MISWRAHSLARRSARGFRGAAEFSPEIELPSCRHIQLSGTSFERREEGRLCASLIADACPSSDTGKLVGTGDSELCLRLQDAGSRDPDIIVLLQCRADERAELLVLEDFPPFLIAEGGGLGFRRFFRRQTAIGGGDGCDGLLVVWSGRAAGTQDRDTNKGNGLVHLSPPLQG